MPEKQKIILYTPKPRRHTFSRQLPIAMLKLASMLDRKKYDIKIISANPDCDYKKELVENSKDALCFALRALTGYDIIDAIETIKMVKKVNPKLPIIWGGWHCSILPEQTLKSKHADIVVIAQGERTFAELVERLSAKKSLRGLLGIAYKQNGKIIRNKPRPFEDINNFPPLPYDLVNIEQYVDNFDGMRAMIYVTSQGCPFACKYCAEPLVFNRRWSSLSNDRILKDWEFFAKEHNIEFMILADDNFFIGEERIRDFCKKLIAKKLPLKWGRAQARVRQMLQFSDDTWRLIKKSGLYDVQIGIESGQQEILDFINKQLTVDETARFVKRARKIGLKATPEGILGLPTPKMKGASPKEWEAEWNGQLNAMFDLLDRCYPDKKDYDEIRFFAFDPYPGNPMYDLSLELGFDPPKTLEEWGTIRPANWISKKMRKQLDMLMYFIFPYARDAYQERHIKRFKPLQKLFHKSAQWRWKHRFFAFPVEYWMYKLYTGTRTKITGQSATEHN